MMIFSFRNYFGCCSSYLSYDPYSTHYIFGRSKTNHDQIDGTWWHNIGEIRPWIETFMRQYFSYVFGKNMVRLQTRSQCLDENARPVSEMDILKFKVRRLPVFRAQKWWVALKDWIHAQEWLYIATADTCQKTLVGLIKVYIHTEIVSMPQHPQISSSLEHVLRFYAFVFGG